MIGVILLVVLALAWISFAVVNDVKKRIVPNWLNFSLIIFALGFRFFYSLFSNNFGFLYQGIIGFAIFFVLGNAFYYGRMFAGGDAKLMIALGTVLPFSGNFFANLNIFTMFFILFLFSGAIYGMFSAFYLLFTHFNICRREFLKRFRKNKNKIYLTMFAGILFILFGFYSTMFFYLGIFVFILPCFYIFAKSVDEACLVRNVKAKDLTEGDWLYKDLKIGKKIIRADWDGLNLEDIKLIRKKFKEIKIKQGIPFTPVFLISFIILIYLYFNGIGVMNFI